MDFPALQRLHMSGIEGSALLPGGDISLLLPRTLMELHLSCAVPFDVTADDFLQAVTAAPALTTIRLENALDLTCDESSEEEEEEEEMMTFADLAAADLGMRLFGVLLRLQSADVNDHVCAAVTGRE
eukprot:jgi/Tetstr1/466663/TSEL_011151.t1